MSNSGIRKELIRLKGLQQVRGLVDNASKAAFVLIHYCGELEFSLRQLSKCFNVGRGAIEGRVNSLLEGHTEHGLSKPKYLSSFHEARLAAILNCAKDKRESIVDEEVLEMVCPFLSSN